MTSNIREVTLMDKQVSVRFSEGKHQYRVKVHEEDGSITYPELEKGKYVHDSMVHIPKKFIGKFNLTTSVTSVSKYVGDKQFLIGWSAKKATEYFGERLFPGIQITSKDLVTWMKEAPQARYKSLDKGADRGNIIHEWLENYVRWQLGLVTKQPDIPTQPKIKGAIESFLQFEEEWNLEYIDTERIIYDPLTNVAGTLDIVAKSNKGLLITDIKTGGGIYPEMHLQIAAYRRGYFYDTKQYADMSVILFIPRDGSLCIPVYEELDDEVDYAAYLAACSIYWWWKSKGR